MTDETPPPRRSPALPWLWGARIQRIDGPSPGLFCFSLFHQGQRSVLCVWVSAARRGLGATSERPQGAPASAFVQRLRTQFENARVLEAHWLASPASPDGCALALEFVAARGPEQSRWLADFDTKEPGLILLGPQGRPLGSSDERALRARWPDRGEAFKLGRGRGVPIATDPESLRAAAEALLEAGERSTHDGLRRELKSRVQAALKRAERKAAAIRGDLERAAQAPQLRREADVLLCNLQAIARGSSTIRLLDESTEPPSWLDISLDPTRDAQQNAQQRYERARKVERGVGIAQERLHSTQSLVDELSSFARELELAGPAELHELHARAASSGLGGQPAAPTKKRGAQAVRVPYRSFVGHGDHSILVGKGAQDNDVLTLKVARPHDHWLHARGLHGAHVVIPRQRDQAIAPELLLDAAHLAAHFSAARAEPLVEIQHTERRYLRKPKGSAPGLVQVDREKVLLLRVEPARLQRLLASERAAQP